MILSPPSLTWQCHLIVRFTRTIKTKTKTKAIVKREAIFVIENSSNNDSSRFMSVLVNGTVQSTCNDKLNWNSLLESYNGNFSRITSLWPTLRPSRLNFNLLLCYCNDCRNRFCQDAANGIGSGNGNSNGNGN